MGFGGEVKEYSNIGRRMCLFTGETAYWTDRNKGFVLYWFSRLGLYTDHTTFTSFGTVRF